MAVSPSIRIVPGCTFWMKYSQLACNRSIPARIASRPVNSMWPSGMRHTPSAVKSAAKRS